ncbi:MAG: TIGR03617 family F420-dependent LLM class oxidoreductase [Myxococcota bacterium]|nr:TIGR03617 family F420-dependent LLM class oxidoreductase [Myxococcota bacterium]
MKVDGAILVENPLDAGPAASRLESVGYTGGFTFEGRHDPFLPLTVAAQQTERLELITAIAIAFARNPMTLANIGWDMQLLSGGRFILGLGTQIRPHIQKRFSMEWSKPALRMKEMVCAIRAIWDCWENGSKLDFRGEFYTHTLMTPVFTPEASPHGAPAIFLSAVGPRMTEVVGEVADGFFVHPFHTSEFIESLTLPHLQKGYERAGRSRSDLEVSCQLIVAAGDNDEEIEAAKNGARAQISFYGSTPAYRPVLDSIGRGELQDELTFMSKQGKWLEMAGRIDDDLLERIAVVGHRSEIASKVRARAGHFADRVSLVAPFAPDPEQWADIVADLAEGG